MTVQKLMEIYETSSLNVEEIKKTIERGFTTSHRAVYQTSGKLATGEDFEYKLTTSDRRYNVELGKVFITVTDKLWVNGKLEDVFCEVVERDLTDEELTAAINSNQMRWCKC